MSVLVLSCGRTGTNMLLESLSASEELNATTPAEHKELFRNPQALPENYLSKCDTVYISHLMQIKYVFDKNPNLKILWTTRDWRDTALSKIYRGQPGNDTRILSDDATPEGCLEDIDWMSKVYKVIKHFYPDSIMVVKMEDVILNYESTLKNVCEFCGISYNEEMKNFVHRYRGSVKETKGKRYSGIDKSQISLYKRKDEIYEGFFKTHDIDLEVLFEKLQPYLKEFKYI